MHFEEEKPLCKSGEKIFERSPTNTSAQNFGRKFVFPKI